MSCCCHCCCTPCCPNRCCCCGPMFDGAERTSGFSGDP
jgi:hypothetical protein